MAIDMKGFRLFKPERLTVQEAYDIIKHVAYWSYHRFPKVYSKRIAYKEMPNFIKWATAMFKHESSHFNRYAKNPKTTATGFGQVTWATRVEFESKKHLGFSYAQYNPTEAAKIKNPHEVLYDPFYGSLVALANFVYQYNRYGRSWQKAIIAYNQGHWTASKPLGYYNTVVQSYKNLDFAELEKNSKVKPEAIAALFNSDTAQTNNDEKGNNTLVIIDENTTNLTPAIITPALVTTDNNNYREAFR